MGTQTLIDRITDQDWLDRVPLLPMWGILTFGAVMGINGAFSLLTDYKSPWWISWPMLVTFFLLIFRAARAERRAKAAGGNEGA